MSDDDSENQSGEDGEEKEEVTDLSSRYEMRQEMNVSFNFNKTTHIMCYLPVT